MPIEIIDTLKPKNGQQFAIADSNDILGSCHTVETIDERDSIPEGVKRVGMICFVKNVNKNYQLRYKVNDDSTTSTEMEWIEIAGADQVLMYDYATFGNNVPISSLHKAIVIKQDTSSGDIVKIIPSEGARNGQRIIVTGNNIRPVTLKSIYNEDRTISGQNKLNSLVLCNDETETNILQGQSIEFLFADEVWYEISRSYNKTLTPRIQSFQGQLVSALINKNLVNNSVEANTAYDTPKYYTLNENLTAYKGNKVYLSAEFYIKNLKSKSTDVNKVFPMTVTLDITYSDNTSDILIVGPSIANVSIGADYGPARIQSSYGGLTIRDTIKAIRITSLIHGPTTTSNFSATEAKISKIKLEVGSYTDYTEGNGTEPASIKPLYLNSATSQIMLTSTEKDLLNRIEPETEISNGHRLVVTSIHGMTSIQTLNTTNGILLANDDDEISLPQNHSLELLYMEGRWVELSRSYLDPTKVYYSGSSDQTAQIYTGTTMLVIENNTTSTKSLTRIIPEKPINGHKISLYNNGTGTIYINGTTKNTDSDYKGTQKENRIIFEDENLTSTTYKMPRNTIIELVYISGIWYEYNIFNPFRSAIINVDILDAKITENSESYNPDGIRQITVTGSTKRVNMYYGIDTENEPVFATILRINADDCYEGQEIVFTIDEKGKGRYDVTSFSNITSPTEDAIATKYNIKRNICLTCYGGMTNPYRFCFEGSFKKQVEANTTKLLQPAYLKLKYDKLRDTWVETGRYAGEDCTRRAVYQSYRGPHDRFVDSNTEMLFLNYSDTDNHSEVVSNYSWRNYTMAPMALRHIYYGSDPKPRRTLEWWYKTGTGLNSPAGYKLISENAGHKLKVVARTTNAAGDAVQSPNIGLYLIAERRTGNYGSLSVDLKDIKLGYGDMLLLTNGESVEFVNSFGGWAAYSYGFLIDVPNRIVNGADGLSAQTDSFDYIHRNDS